MEAKAEELKEDKHEVLVTFLKQTRDGKYAKIEESSLPYARMEQQQDDTCPVEDNYYYSLR
jgi:hypothetical protein